MTGVGGEVVNFTEVDRQNYFFYVVPDSDGLLTVTYPFASARDAATNPTLAGPVVTFEIGMLMSLYETFEPMLSTCVGMCLGSCRPRYTHRISGNA